MTSSIPAALRMQNGRTSELIFAVSKLVATLSTTVTLYPGDVIGRNFELIGSPKMIEDTMITAISAIPNQASVAGRPALFNANTAAPTALMLPMIGISGSARHTDRRKSTTY
jgi:hypothetical protein